MTATEVHDARDAVQQFRAGALVHWAPGDATLYRVALVDRATVDGAYRLTALLVAVGTSGYGPYLVVQAPRADYDRWTPEVFVRAYGQRFASWWPGVRPLLAALSWTAPPHDAVAYDPTDADRVDAALGELPWPND